MAFRKQRQSKIEPDRAKREAPIVTKVSGKNLDEAIERLSQATAPYFRSGGPLMPDKHS